MTVAQFKPGVISFGESGVKTGSLRWLAEPRTTTKNPTLQEQWQIRSVDAVRYEWRDVPIVQEETE